MFDIGFMELLICGVIALLVLGPERLPGAARTAGRWVGRSRRLMRQFTSELDRQLKADELREQLRKEGGIDLDGMQKNVQAGLSKAREYQHFVLSDEQDRRTDGAPVVTETTPQQGDDEVEPPMPERAPTPVASEAAADDNERPDTDKAAPENRR